MTVKRVLHSKQKHRRRNIQQIYAVLKTLLYISYDTKADQSKSLVKFAKLFA